MKNMSIFNIKKKYFSPASLEKYFSEFWENNFRIFFAIFSVVVLSLGIFLWYQSIFQSDWNSEKKNQYKNSKNKNIELKENQFKNVIEEVNRKRAFYEGKNDPIKDIFAPYVENKLETDTSQNLTNEKSSKQITPSF